MLYTAKTFRAPPEAPVFEPSAKEFADPLAYIARIRPVAEKTGICKIRPPPDWQPPFTIDLESFRFTPRVQCLRELEATTRVALNFLEKLAKFWEFQRSPLKIPHVDKKLLDLHALFKAVHTEGGFDKVNREKKWGKIAFNLGHSGNSCNVIRQHYEKLLYPYEVFESSLKLCNQKSKKEEVKPRKDDAAAAAAAVAVEDGVFVSHSLGGRCAGKMSRSVPKGEGIDYHANSELRKLQFFGAGPKAAIPVYDKDENDGKPEGRWKMRDRSCGKPKYMESDACQICEKSDDEQQMLLCDSCSEFVHMYCLRPPLQDTPKVEWRCPKCIAKECNAPREAYGFAQSKKTYTLPEFGEMADKFKSEYFRMAPHEIPYDVVENEFWRLVSSIEDDVSVQYGADIHALTNGSGFPTDTTTSDPLIMEYVKSGWNLNNLPILEESVLRWVSGDVSGMKVPWCYVGMCFSSFAWHIEDHWTYSINYLHWGEPKTWYGASSEYAERLETEMKGCAPELFEQAPDLLHQLTTLMNPNVLMERGIPIVRTNQNAGEFVITFPRSYHAGFNQGYNFAEAVNFCPSDWLPFGRSCIENYKLVKRQCVFSHEELICKMAAEPARLNVSMAVETHSELQKITASERQKRSMLQDKGCKASEREAFELVPDDERQCVFCKTTCFLSAVMCPCKPGILVCIAHDEELCHCPSSTKCLKYRYTLDELNAMLSRLNNRAHSFDIWSQKASSALTVSSDFRLPLANFKDLVREWTENKLPPSDLFQQLSTVVEEAQDCSQDAQFFLQRKTSPVISHEANDGGRLTFAKLNDLNIRMSRLRCHIKEINAISDLVRQVGNLRSKIQFMVADDAVLAEPDASLRKLEKLQTDVVALGIIVPEVEHLEEVTKQVKWLLAVKPLLTDCPAPWTKARKSLDALRHLIDEGRFFDNNPVLNKAVCSLQRLKTVTEQCEEKALAYLQCRTKSKLDELEAFISESKVLPISLLHVPELVKLVQEARSWNMRAAEPQPFLSELKMLLSDGQRLPVQLELLPRIEVSVRNALAWQDTARRAFIRKHAQSSLLEVLQPRRDLRPKCPIANNAEADEKPILECIQIEEQDSKSVSAAYVQMERKEVEDMLRIRAANRSQQRCLASRELTTSDSGVCLPVCGRSSPEPSRCSLCLELRCKGNATGSQERGSTPEKRNSSCGSTPEKRNSSCGSSANRSDRKTSGSGGGSCSRVLCESCLRSKRPRLDVVLNQLLLPLHALKPVRVPEGEALSSLVARAVAWQKRAQHWLHENTAAGDASNDNVLSETLEKLFVEGNLIELTLPEQDLLWKVCWERSESISSPDKQHRTIIAGIKMDLDDGVLCYSMCDAVKRKADDSRDYLSDDSSLSNSSEGDKKLKLERSDEGEVSLQRASLTSAAASTMTST